MVSPDDSPAPLLRRADRWTVHPGRGPVGGPLRRRTSAGKDRVRARAERRFRRPQPDRRRPSPPRGRSRPSGGLDRDGQSPADRCAPRPRGRGHHPGHVRSPARLLGVRPPSRIRQPGRRRDSRRSDRLRILGGPPLADLDRSPPQGPAPRRNRPAVLGIRGLVDVGHRPGRPDPLAAAADLSTARRHEPPSRDTRVDASPARCTRPEPPPRMALLGGPRATGRHVLPLGHRHHLVGTRRGQRGLPASRPQLGLPEADYLAHRGGNADRWRTRRARRGRRPLVVGVRRHVDAHGFRIRRRAAGLPPVRHRFPEGRGRSRRVDGSGVDGPGGRPALSDAYRQRHHRPDDLPGSGQGLLRGGLLAAGQARAMGSRHPHGPVARPGQPDHPVRHRHRPRRDGRLRVRDVVQAAPDVAPTQGSARRGLDGAVVGLARPGPAGLVSRDLPAALRHPSGRLHAGRRLGDPSRRPLLPRMDA